MLLDERSRIAKAWRDRLAGRSVIDRDVATTAIGEAYEHAGLPPPQRIIWTGGPREAADAIAFLRTPPMVLWRFSAVLAALDAVIWVGLLVGLALRLLPSASDDDWVAFATTLSAFLIVVGSLRPIPVPPGLAKLPRYREFVAWGAALAIITIQPLWCTTLLGIGAVGTDPLALIAVLVPTAAVGSLGGLLLAARVYVIYRVLPPYFRSMRPAASVGWQLRRARKEAWARFQRFPHVIPWSDQLLRQRQNAHALAFRDGSAAAFHAVGPVRAVTVVGHPASNLLAIWQTRAFETVPTMNAPADFLDGMEDATRAFVAQRVGAADDALCFAQIAFQLDRLYPFGTVAVAVLPAARVAIDGDERLHSGSGPALSWADGTSVSMWHGQPVDADLVDDTFQPSRALIALEFDPGRRRVLIERFGLGRYMLECGADEVHRDSCGTLYRLDQRFEEPIVSVRVVNHTAGPDGAFDEFWLRVPPTTRTAQEAVAWTFGLTEDEYRPLLQS